MSSEQHMTARSASAMLDMLSGNGHIEEPAVVEAFVLSRQGRTELPLYLRVLAGVGAAFSSVWFIGVLFLTGSVDFNDAIGLIMSGLLFMAVGIGLQRVSGAEPTVIGSFLLQTSFAAMAGGKVLFVFGVGTYSSSGWDVPLGILIVTAATYHVYRMSIDRFLSSFAVLFSVLLNIASDYTFGEPRAILFNGFFLAQLTCAAVLLTHGRIGRDYLPIAYAFAFSLCATVLLIAASQRLGLRFYPEMEIFNPVFMNAFLAGALIALFAWAAGGIDSLKQQPLVTASVGAVLLGAVSAPGVLLAIGLMILGYARHDRLLLTLGALLMPAFLWLYYYNLDVSLLTKSLILAGSGVILLVGRVYLETRVQSHET